MAALSNPTLGPLPLDAITSCMPSCLRLGVPSQLAALSLWRAVPDCCRARRVPSSPSRAPSSPDRMVISAPAGALTTCT
jgi:hypothetical protein